MLLAKKYKEGGAKNFRLHREFGNWDTQSEDEIPACVFGRYRGRLVRGGGVALSSVIRFEAVK